MKIYLHYYPDGDKSYSTAEGITISNGGTAPVKTTILTVDDLTGDDFFKNPDDYIIDDDQGTVIHK